MLFASHSAEKCPRQWPLSVVGELESSSHGLMGMDVPSPWCWGTPVALLEKMDEEFFHLPWVLVLLHGCRYEPSMGKCLRWGWHEEGWSIISTPPPTFVPVCSSLCVQSSFLSHYLTILLLECLAKSLFSLLMFLFKQAVFKLLKWQWNISSWGNPY